ncbi:MAG: tetratricopeptide repeat protein [Pseudomonadales bacterium]|nr:tetratricopeptide repeat protein [Pseudomonadales bacterium]
MNQLFAAVFFVAAGMMGNVPETLKGRVDAGQYKQAYEYAQQWRDDYEGVPDYDLYYGIAALELGYYPEAAMAFERVLMVTPENHRARVELGRVMFLMRDYSEAEQAFHDVLRAKPPAPVQHRIQIFLDNIKARQKARDYAMSISLDMKAGYSSNINSATSAQSTSDFSFIGGSIDLFEGDRKTESAYMDSRVRLNVTRPINERRLQFLTLEYQDITNEEVDDFNIDVLNLSAGYMANIGSSQFRFPISYQAVSIDNEFTQSFVSIGFDSITPLDKQSDWINFAILGAKRFKDDHLRDTDLAMLGTGYGRLLWGARVKAVASIFIGEDKARQQDSQGNTFGGVRGALEYRLNLDQTLYLNGLYQEARYHNKGVFVEVRKDKISEGILGWRWRIAKNASVMAEINYTDNDSNLTLFSYDRAKSQVGFTYVFE